VSEALWKKPVIGGKAGGIKIQVIHGVTGFLMTSPKTAAHYTVFLLREDRAREEWGCGEGTREAQLPKPRP
jgi:trehalose synthase